MAKYVIQQKTNASGTMVDLKIAASCVESDSTKMDKANPTGTGSLSIGREANTTIGENSSAVGKYVTASGAQSHGEGFTTTASGSYSHAEGYRTTASGSDSHAEGYETKAQGNCSHAEGFYTTAKKQCNHVFGRYNIEDTENDPLNVGTNYGRYIEVVGNGTSNSTSSNARTLDWNGNEILAGSSTAASFKTPLGTSSQFLKADGSVDSNAYITAAALPTIDQTYDGTSTNAQSGVAVASAVSNVMSVAEGKTKSYVINAATDITGTKDANDEYTGVSAITGVTIANLKIGDIILIKALNVPDYWVSQISPSVSLNKMETTKVDLTNYLTDVEASDINSGNATSGQVLVADGSGGASWGAAASAGGSNVFDLGTISGDISSDQVVVLTSAQYTELTSGDVDFVKFTDSNGIVWYCARLLYYSGAAAAFSSASVKVVDNNNSVINILVSTEGNTPFAMVSKKSVDIAKDSSPVQNSTNAVESGGVYTALSGKQDTLSTSSTSNTAPVATFLGFDANGDMTLDSNAELVGLANPASNNVYANNVFGKDANGNVTLGYIDQTSIQSPNATAGQVLTADGNGNASWATPSGESTSNKVTSLSSSSTDTQYPSAKCVYDMIGDVESLLTAINSGNGV